MGEISMFIFRLCRAIPCKSISHNLEVGGRCASKNFADLPLLVIVVVEMAGRNLCNKLLRNSLHQLMAVRLALKSLGLGCRPVSSHCFQDGFDSRDLVGAEEVGFSQGG